MTDVLPFVSDREKFEWFMDEYAMRWRRLTESDGVKAWSELICGGEGENGMNIDGMRKAFVLLEEESVRYGPKGGRFRWAYNQAMKILARERAPTEDCGMCGRAHIVWCVIGGLVIDKLQKIDEPIRLPYLYTNLIPCKCSGGLHYNSISGPRRRDEHPQPMYKEDHLRRMHEGKIFLNPGAASDFMRECREEGRAPLDMNNQPIYWWQK